MIWNIWKEVAQKGCGISILGGVLRLNSVLPWAILYDYTCLEEGTELETHVF